MQPTEGGYYRFGELPQLIAEALHPDEMYPDDVYLSAIVWRDDSTEHGQYFKCTPPPGLIADGMTCLDGWSVTPVTKEEEAEDPDADEWRRLRKRAEHSDRLSDGSLLILAEKTQRGVLQVLNIGLERDWYKERMTTDAQRNEDDKRRLCVVDSNLNSLTYTNGSALDRGWVHINKLNQWGATLDTVNVFSVGEGSPQESGQQGAIETPKQRRHRWLAEFEEVGQLQRVYEAEKQRNPSADRSTIGKQIKKARLERDQERQAASAPPQTAARRAAHPFSILGIDGDKAAE